jgi:hypothetical protein
MNNTRPINRVYYLLILILVPIPAYAYIDPGSSLLLIQGALAAIGGILMIVRNPIKVIKKLIAKLRGENDA